MRKETEKTAKPENGKEAKKAAKLEAKTAKLEAKAAKSEAKKAPGGLFKKAVKPAKPEAEAKQAERLEYVVCPRCELNYIAPKDKLCKVCKAEIGLIDASILIPEEEETERLCPICNVNYIGEDEMVCFLCLKERDKKTGDEEEEWVEFEIEPDDEDLQPEEDLGIRPEDMGFDEDEDEEGEEEVDYSDQYKEPDDFEYEVDEDDFLDRPEDEDDEDEDEDDF